MRLAELINVLDPSNMAMIIYDIVDEFGRTIICDCDVENIKRLMDYNLIHPFLYVTCITVDCDECLNISVKKELPEDE